MSLHDLRLIVHQGDGVVARFAGVVLLVPSVGANQKDAAGELLEMVRAAGEGGQAPGRLVSRQVAYLLSQTEPGSVPAFCVLADADTGIAVILHGAIELTVEGDGPTLRLSGRETSTWLERTISEPFRTLVAGETATDPGASDIPVDLTEGVVRGAGLTMTATESGSPISTPDDPGLADAAPPPRARLASMATLPPARPHEHEHPVADRAAPARNRDDAPTDIKEARGDERRPAPPGSADAPSPKRSQSLLERGTVERRPPLPVGASQGAAAPSGPRVLGRACKRGHFNAPDARYCGVCGIHMVHETHVLVEGPRPVLGFMVYDDGTTYSLDVDYLIGREPGTNPAVQAGTARPLALVDEAQTISRVHLTVHLEEWDVVVVDEHSANGTYVWAPGDPAWTRLDPGRPFLLHPASHVLIGRRSFVFEALNKR